MEVGDNVVLNNGVDISDEWKRHGIIIGIDSSGQSPIEILFADGVLENYNHRDCRVVSDKEYFKLQLS